MARAAVVLSAKEANWYRTKLMMATVEILTSISCISVSLFPASSSLVDGFIKFSLLLSLPLVLIRRAVPSARVVLRIVVEYGWLGMAPRGDI